MSIDLNSVVSSVLFQSNKPNFQTFANLAAANDEAVASGISIAIAVFSVVGTFVIALSALPQTIKTMKDKDTANLSFLLFFLTGIATFALFLYGIGLVTVPTNSIVFLMGKTLDTNEYVFNYEEWVAGYLVPGILLIIGELFASITSFMVAFAKLQNKSKAKKVGLSEADYYNKYVKPTLKIKGGK